MMPNFNFETYYLPQVPDSAQTKKTDFSFESSSQKATNEESTILSTDFRDQKVDSLVEIKTQRLRKISKKKIKTHKVIDCDIIIKKDTFLFLQRFQNKAISLCDLEPYYKPLASYKKSISTQNLTVKAHPKKEKTTSKKTSTTQLSESSHLSIDKDFGLRSEWWLMIVLFMALLYSAIIKIKFNTRLSSYPFSFFTYHYFQKLFRDQNALDIRLSQSLAVLFSVNASLLVFYGNLEFSWVNLEWHHSLITLSALGIIISYHIIFALFNKVLAFILEAPKIINEYLYNILFLNNIFGIIALPLVIIYPFLNTPLNRFVLYIAFGTYAFTYLLRWWRGFQISFKNNVPLFYLILYLCTLEIIPVILIYKLIFL